MKPLNDAAQAAVDVENAFQVIASTSKIKPITTALTKASQSLSSVITDLKENHKRQHIDVRKQLVRLNNAVEGMLEGVASRDISLSQLRSNAERISKNFVPALTESISTEYDALTEGAPELNERQLRMKNKLSLETNAKQLEQALSATFDPKTGFVKLNLISGLYKGGMPDAPDPRMQELEDKATQKLREQIKTLREDLKEMPTRMKGNFKLYQFPLIPTFKQDKSFLVDPRSDGISKMRRIGVNAVGVEGYAVMLNQKVLTISKKFCQSHGLEPKQAAEAVLELIREKGMDNLVLVSDKYRHCPNNGDLLMFWIMPPAQLAAFSKLAHGLGDMIWAFPN